MSFLRGCTWKLLTLGFVLPLGAQGLAQPSTAKLNKVIIVPGAHDSIGQLKQSGVSKVDNYGSYWVAEATDAQADALKETYGDRASKANYLNKIELLSMTLDTTETEPAVPSALRQAASKAKHLRLIQFKGPVQPEWLDQVKAVGKISVVSYIPNNAYLVWLDQAAEDSLNSLMAPSGPIQWIGTYPPYYKMDPLLPNVAESTIDVQVGVVNGAETEQTLQAIGQYTLQQPGKPSILANQALIRIKVNPANLTAIAQMPGVLWIQRNAPMEPKDETQALIMADQIGQLPGHGPVPGVDDYLNLLTNVWGFSTDAGQYPILDVADTIGSSTSLDDDFFEFGNPTNATRLAGFISICEVNAMFCDTFHGPFVMSVGVGYNDSRASNNVTTAGFRKGLGVSPFGRVSNAIVFHLAGTDCNFCVPNPQHPQLADIPLNEYQVFGARISNNSWGQAPVAGNGGNIGIYDGDSLSYDVTTRDALDSGTSVINSNSVPPPPFPLNQEMITVFSGGNAQGLGSGNGGFGDIIVTPPATAKNVISVGASENVVTPTEAFNDCGLFPSAADDSFNISDFSSFGPTIDGRFKPEIVAPGSGIFAVFDGLNGEYVCASGTSFSAPAVSGALQLLWWWFQQRLLNEQGQHLLQPSPAMAKAYVCNSARYLPIANPQTGAPDTLPSIAQGMGIIDLLRMFDNVPRVIRDESTPRAIDISLVTSNPAPQQTFFSRSGQSYEVSGNVADATQPFRVTLAWLDAPGNPAAFKQLVNDLDLQVTVGGQTYKGNVFSGPNSVAGGTADALNNIESVFLPPGLTGTWSVVVRAVNIAGLGVPNVNSAANQDFALVVYNAAASPSRSDVPNLATNDSCQTALAITTFPSTFTNNLTKAVYHNVHPSPTAARGGADEFFKIERPTVGTQFTVSTIGSGFDTVLSVWQVQVFPQVATASSPCGSLIEIVSTNVLSGSQLTFTADGSNTYYIVVEPHNNGAGGTLVLNVAASAPPVTLNPANLIFDPQYVGTTSAVQTVTYLNNAPVNVDIGSVTIQGPNASDFLIVSESCSGNTVPPNGSCTISIVFAPTANGLRTAQLVVQDDATGSPRIALLRGTGLPPAPAICLSTGGNLSFGSVSTGFVSAVQSLTITNCGTADLFITNLVISGSASNDYSVVSDTCSGNLLTPGSSCDIGITFAPTTTGTRSATLLIINNSTNSPAMVALSGTGRLPAPQVCLSGGSLTFAGQEPGTTSAVQSVTVTNCGEANLVVNGATVTGAYASDFMIVSNICTNGPIATNSTCTIGLVFIPGLTNIANRTATLQITDNAAGSPQTVALSGTAIGSQPDLLISKKPKLKKALGAGIINDTGDDQTLVLKVRRGKKKVFYVVFQNAGIDVDNFLVDGGGDVPGQLTASYFVGAKNYNGFTNEVTSAVVAGSYSTASLASGAITGDATLLRLQVNVSRTAAPGTNDVLITGASSLNPSKVDTVRARVIVR